MGQFSRPPSSAKLSFALKVAALILYTLIIYFSTVTLETGRCVPPGAARTTIAALSDVGSTQLDKEVQPPAEEEFAPFMTRPLDLRHVLGLGPALDGLLYEPHLCFAPIRERDFSGMGGGDNEQLQQQLKASLQQDLVAGVAAAVGAPPASVNETSTFASMLHTTDVTAHAEFVEMRKVITELVSFYVLTPQNHRFCVCGERGAGEGPIKDLSELGNTGCADGESATADDALQCLGAFPGSLLATPGASVASITEHIFQYGWCSANPAYVGGFANWFLKERLYSPEWKTFAVDTRDEDIMLELLDAFYERHHIFLQQRWLGFAVMQDPFDLLVLQNLIHELKPDLIIETGTANGGSALLWASILELSGLHSSRIVTVDPNHPLQGFGSTSNVVSPANHTLWDKYVTFHQGLSTSDAFLELVASMAAGKKTVLVLLDSDHSPGVVAQELDALCAPYVTPGSYCVAEDTKLSRMTVRGGPLEPVREFLAKNANFTADRHKELGYSQHVGAYLLRH